METNVADKKARKTAPALAIHGGQPVRSEPLPLPLYGTLLTGEDELALLTEVVKSQTLFRFRPTGGARMAERFEANLRGWFGIPHALATATGSGSFCCALAALGIGPGDEVIIPAFGWYTLFNGPAHLGALPVLAEIDESMSLDIRDVERKITPRTRGILVVHFQGASRHIEDLVALAKKHGLFLLEDCAQSCGASVHGKKLGTFGDVACFSMQHNKILSTGDGGFLLTRNADLFERAIRYHDHGGVRPHFHLEETKHEGLIGLQFRMNELTAAAAVAQFGRLEWILERTRSIHARLQASCPGIRFRPLDDEQGDAGIALYFLFEDGGSAARFGAALEAEGIRVGPSSSCCNLTTHPFLQKRRMAHPDMPPFGRGCAGELVRYSEDDYAQTRSVLQRLVALAITPSLTDLDENDIHTAVAKVWAGLGLGTATA